MNMIIDKDKKDQLYKTLVDVLLRLDALVFFRAKVKLDANTLFLQLHKSIAIHVKERSGVNQYPKGIIRVTM